MKSAHVDVVTRRRLVELRKSCLMYTKLQRIINVYICGSDHIYSVFCLKVQLNWNILSINNSFLRIRDDNNARNYLNLMLFHKKCKICMFELVRLIQQWQIGCSSMRIQSFHWHEITWHQLVCFGSSDFCLLQLIRGATTSKRKKKEERQKESLNMIHRELQTTAGLQHKVIRNQILARVCVLDSCTKGFVAIGFNRFGRSLENRRPPNNKVY